MTKPKENDADHCVEDIELGETEATRDVELPPSRGGVEQPVVPSS